MRHAPMLAIHCGANHVACGAFSRSPKEVALEHFATAPLGFGESSDDDWLAAVGRALTELVRKGKLRGACIVGLPGHLTFNRGLTVPAVTARQRRRIIAFEQHRGLPAAAEPMVWSHALLSKDAGGAEMMLAVARRRTVERLVASIREAGLNVEAVLPAWMVLRLAIGFRAKAAEDTLILSIGTRSSWLVGWGTRGFSVRTFAVGGNIITQRVAEDLKLVHAEAERLKLQGFAGSVDLPAGEPERAAGRRAIEQFVRRLCAELLRTQPLLSPSGDIARPAVLWLTGGGARLPELPGILAERLQLRVECWNPRSRVDLERASAEHCVEPDDATLVDLLGLHAYSASVVRSEGNLLPRSFQQEAFVRRRWPMLTAAAILAIAILLAPIWRNRCKAREIRKQIAETESTIAVLGRVATSNQSNRTRLAEIEHRIAALRRLERARSAWMLLLEDFQERFSGVQDVWLDRLQLMGTDSGDSSVLADAVPPQSHRKPPGRPPDPKEAGVTDHLVISGHLLDVDRLGTGAADDECPRANTLLTALRASPLIAAVEREHFIGVKSGLWRFEINLRLAPDALK